MEFTINIDTRTKSGIQLIDFLKSLNFVKIKEPEVKKPSSLLLSAMNDTEKGKTTKITGKDKLSKILKDA